MSGHLSVVAESDQHQKHDHVDLAFNNGCVVRFNDPRRFGSLHWQPKDTVHWTLENLGPEPLTEDFTGKYLHQVSRNRKRCIKSLLMDSKIVSGVGNIYANEALFAAGVRPHHQSSRVTKAQCEAIVKAIKEVLEAALVLGGTTLRDFMGAQGERGYFALKLQVYGCGGQPCSKCETTLMLTKLNQRQTVYCPNCQR